MRLQIFYKEEHHLIDTAIWHPNGNLDQVTFTDSKGFNRVVSHNPSAKGMSFRALHYDDLETSVSVYKGEYHEV